MINNIQLGKNVDPKFKSPVYSGNDPNSLK